MKLSNLFKAMLFGFFGSFGVVGEDAGGEEAVGSGNDARVALLNSIADGYDEARAEELLSINDDGTTEPFTFQQPGGVETPLENEEAVDEDAQAEIARLAAESGQDPEPQPVQKHKIKVNGREIELTYEELVARAQKVETADVYLAEASRLRNELAAQPKPPVQDVPVPSVEDDLAIARAIQMGTEEEAVAALQKLRQSQKSLSPDDISRTIDERLTFNEAISKYRAEFSDVVTDPVLNKLALELDAQLIANGDRRPYYDRYKDVGTQVRNWAVENAKKFAPAQEQPQANKLARKAATPTPPKAQSQKAPTTVEQEREESTSDIIAGIAKSRGGPQWMNGIR